MKYPRHYKPERRKCILKDDMHIYFSGIGGVGIGPLAEIAQDAGYQVSGSDLAPGSLTRALAARGITVGIGQDGSHIKEVHQSSPIDWFVYTAALSEGRPELAFAEAHGIRTSKRDELLAAIIKDKDLRLVAVAGTHGKTTTSGMLVWLFKQLGIPASYSVGSTLGFGPSGCFDPASRYFIYECDEYDRNFLHFSPWASLITSIDYDHPNIFPTISDYKQAFRQFLAQSTQTYLWHKDARYLGGDQGLGRALEAMNPQPRRLIEVPNTADTSAVHLSGEHTRRNGYLAGLLTADVAPPAADIWQHIYQALAGFPGTDRRFEKLADNLYSDYGHHPVEIAATLQMAREINQRVVLVYQPHQNVRQHAIKDDYRHSMRLAERIYWLPTYLSREDPALPVLSPRQLIDGLENKASAEAAEANDDLWRTIETLRRQGLLVLVMGAGSIDNWARQQLAHSATISAA